MPRLKKKRKFSKYAIRKMLREWPKRLEDPEMIYEVLFNINTTNANTKWERKRNRKKLLKKLTKG